jgi:hypothetical protein
VGHALVQGHAEALLAPRLGAEQVQGLSGAQAREGKQASRRW